MKNPIVSGKQPLYINSIWSRSAIVSFTENTFGSGFERKMSEHRAPKLVIALESVVCMNFWKFPSKEIVLNINENTALSSVVENL